MLNKSSTVYPTVGAVILASDTYLEWDIERFIFRNVHCVSHISRISTAKQHLIFSFPHETRAQATFSTLGAAKPSGNLLLHKTLLSWILTAPSDDDLPLAPSCAACYDTQLKYHTQKNFIVI